MSDKAKSPAIQDPTGHHDDLEMRHAPNRRFQPVGFHSEREKPSRFERIVRPTQVIVNTRQMKQIRSQIMGCRRVMMTSGHLVAYKRMPIERRYFRKVLLSCACPLTGANLFPVQLVLNTTQLKSDALQPTSQARERSRSCAL